MVGGEVLNDRPAVDGEGLRQSVGCLPRLITLENLRDLAWVQPTLFLAGRSDGSIGRLITVLTSENTF
jgi:hypothetical protein